MLFYPEHVLYNSNDQYRQQEELHMTGLGTLINAAAILAGGILGLTFGKFMKPRYQETLTMACGVNLLWEKKVKVANMLPALLIAVIWALR